MHCPRCGRPIALVRPACLYCGAPLPPDVVAEATAPGREPPSSPNAPDPERLPGPEPPPASVPLAHVILDLSQADVRLVAAALGLAPYEAAQRVRRGGFQLHRVLPEAEADAEARRLERAGLTVLFASAEAVRAASQPIVLVGGRLLPERLVGRTAGGSLELVASDLLLVVRGPIRREYQAQPRPHKIRSASLTQGYRFHLHRLSAPQPVELDPEGFEFDDAAGAVASSLLRVAGWLDVLARGVAVDEAFRALPPALGAAQEEGPARLDAARALSARGAAEGRAAGERIVLDNVRQFRAYSAWRGVVERLRAR
jgi:hypothetical protein